MLCLSRNPGEKLFVDCADGTRIVFQIVAVAGGRVRLGIEAPLTVRVLRAELEEQGPLTPEA